MLNQYFHGSSHILYGIRILNPRCINQQTVLMLKSSFLPEFFESEVRYFFFFLVRFKFLLVKSRCLIVKNNMCLSNPYMFDGNTILFAGKHPHPCGKNPHIFHGWIPCARHLRRRRRAAWQAVRREHRCCSSSVKFTGSRPLRLAPRTFTWRFHKSLGFPQMGMGQN